MSLQQIWQHTLLRIPPKFIPDLKLQEHFRLPWASCAFIKKKSYLTIDLVPHKRFVIDFFSLALRDVLFVPGEFVQLAETDLSLVGASEVLSMSSVDWQNEIRKTVLLPKQPSLKRNEACPPRFVFLIKTITNLFNWDVSKWPGCWYNCMIQASRKTYEACSADSYWSHEWERVTVGLLTRTEGPLWHLRLSSSPDRAYMLTV